MFGIPEDDVDETFASNIGDAIYSFWKWKKDVTEIRGQMRIEGIKRSREVVTICQEAPYIRPLSFKEKWMENKEEA